VRFPQNNLGHFVLAFGTSPKYSGTQILARDSHLIDWHPKIQNTTYLCIEFPPPILSPLHSTRGIPCATACCTAVLFMVYIIYTHMYVIHVWIHYISYVCDILVMPVRDINVISSHANHLYHMMYLKIAVSTLELACQIATLQPVHIYISEFEEVRTCVYTYPRIDVCRIHLLDTDTYTCDMHTVGGGFIHVYTLKPSNINIHLYIHT